MKVIKKGKTKKTIIPKNNYFEEDTPEVSAIQTNIGVGGMVKISLPSVKIE